MIFLCNATSLDGFCTGPAFSQDYCATTVLLPKCTEFSSFSKVTRYFSKCDLPPPAPTQAELHSQFNLSVLFFKFV